MPICPGQDTRYWRPEDVFDITCQECGGTVEFFKTDGARRCPGCGTRVQNPRMSLGCAQWCDHAKECLGFDPGELHLEGTREGSLVDRLIQALRQELEESLDQVSHALLVLEHARELLTETSTDTGIDPQVVLAAAALHDVGMARAIRVHNSTDARFHEAEGRPIARRLLESLEFKEEATDHVCKIVGSHHSADEVDSLEFHIVCDADRLVEMPENLVGQSEERLRDIIGQVFRTEAGRQAALRAVTRSQDAADPEGATTDA